MTDILIPLSSSSNNNFEELRYALRSIDKYTDVDNIYVITTAGIPWIKNVKMVYINDFWDDNKDRNIIHKIITTLKLYPEINDFMLWMDDFIVTKELNLKDSPIVYNSRGLASLTNLKRNKWQERLYNTLNVLNILGFDATCNYEAHVPALYNRQKILDGIDSFHYTSHSANYTIFTLFGYLCGYDKTNAVLQDDIKDTFESDTPIPNNYNPKLYIGYNDKGYKHIKKWIINTFAAPSKYEILKDTGIDNSVGVLLKSLKNITKLNEFINNNKDVKIAFVPLTEEVYKQCLEVCIPALPIKLTDNIDENLVTAIRTISKSVNSVCIYEDFYQYPDKYLYRVNKELGDAAIYIHDSKNPVATTTLNPKIDIDITDKTDVINNLENIIRPAILTINNA